MTCCGQDLNAEPLCVTPHLHLERSTDAENPLFLPGDCTTEVAGRGHVTAGDLALAGLCRVGHRSFGADALAFAIPAPSRSVPQFPHLRLI